MVSTVRQASSNHTHTHTHTKHTRACTHARTHTHTHTKHTTHTHTHTHIHTHTHTHTHIQLCVLWTIYQNKPLLECVNRTQWWYAMQGRLGASCVLFIRNIFYLFLSTLWRRKVIQERALPTKVPTERHIYQTVQRAEVLMLLKIALNRQLIFTLRQTATRTDHAGVIWNDIHHKAYKTESSRYDCKDTILHSWMVWS